MTKPALSAILNRPWAIQPHVLKSMIDVAGLNDAPLAYLETDKADEFAPRYNLTDGVAVIPIRGVMLKEVPLIYQIFGLAVTDTTETQLAVEQAAADPDVKAIMLDIDSPGGEVAGVQELGDAIHAAGKIKPIHAHIEDLGASAAYWVAAQANSISANMTAEVGSIGVYSAFYDVSAAAEKAGIRPVVIASGPYKAAGFPGTQVTDPQLEPIREIVNGIAEMFAAAVAFGRDMSIEAARNLATGRVWLAPVAQELGLIDAVSNSEAAFERLVTDTDSIQVPNSIGENAMRLFSRKEKEKADLAAAHAEEAQDADAVEPETVEETVEDKKDAPAEDADKKDEAEETSDESTGAAPAADARAELKVRAEIFGEAFAAKSVIEGMDEIQVRDAFIDKLASDIADRDGQIAKLKSMLEASGYLGEPEAATAQNAEPKAGPVPTKTEVLGENLAKTEAGIAEQLNK